MSPQSNKSAVSAQPLSSVEEDGLDERKNRPPQSSYALDVQALLTRAKLSEELNKMGYPVAAKTLATKASRGGGPPYVLFGRRVLYRWGEALSWAEGRLTAPRCSSSEGDAADANDHKLASGRVHNVAAIKANAAKPKPPAPAEKPAAEKPRPPGGPRKHAAGSPEDHETIGT